MTDEPVQQEDPQTDETERRVQKGSPEAPWEPGEQPYSDRPEQGEQSYGDSPEGDGQIPGGEEPQTPVVEPPD